LIKALFPSTKTTSQANPMPSMKLQSLRSAMKALMINDANKCMCNLFLGFLSFLRTYGKHISDKRRTLNGIERRWWQICSSEENIFTWV